MFRSWKQKVDLNYLDFTFQYYPYVILLLTTVIPVNIVPIWTIDIQLDVVSYRILAFMKPKVFLNKYILLLGEPHIVCAYIYHNVHFRLSWILLFIIPGREREWSNMVWGWSLCPRAYFISTLYVREISAS